MNEMRQNINLHLTFIEELVLILNVGKLNIFLLFKLRVIRVTDIKPTVKLFL